MRNTLLTFLVLAAVSGEGWSGEASQAVLYASDLETWDTAGEWPATDGPWRWGRTGAPLERCSRSDIEKHSGNASWHLKDSTAGPSNESVYWQLSADEVKRLRGRAVRFSAWVKLASASQSGMVGVGIWVGRESNPPIFAKSGPEGTAATPWDRYEATMNIPDDATLIRACLLCAYGFGNTGEAYFDDLQLETKDRTLAASTEERISVDLADYYESTPSAGGRLILFQDTLLPYWGKRHWGGLRSEYTTTDAKVGDKCLKIRTMEGGRPHDGWELFTDRLNRRLDFRSCDPRGMAIEFWVKTPISFTLALIDGGTKTRGVLIDARRAATATDGEWRKHRIPFEEFQIVKPVVAMERLVFQLAEALPPNGRILVDEISVTTGVNGAAPSWAPLSPETQAETASILAEPDAAMKPTPRERPEVKDGTFNVDGHPVFMLGSMTDPHAMCTDWGPGTERDWLTDPIYNRPLDRGIFDILGMNTLQLSIAGRLEGYLHFGVSITKTDLEHEQAQQKFLKGLEGTPFVMALETSGAMQRLLDEKLVSPDAEQQNSDWHSYIPLCPEHPVSQDIQRMFLDTGVQFILKHGGNPFLYELYNESSYNCTCAFNRREFAKRMQIRHGDIAAANAAWKTTFTSFADVEKLSKFESFPAVWVDWCKFVGDRYPEILREDAARVRRSDPRPRVYFTEQISLGNLWKYRGAAMDYRKIAEAIDVLAIEGGWHFGRTLRLGNREGNAMEEALSSDGFLYSFALDTFRAIARNRKPIINNEHYCGRMLFGKRECSRAEDLITAMWCEVFHGASGSLVYSWNKRIWEWKTLEECKAMVVDGGYKAFNLLAPSAYPRTSLDGFKRFSQEVDALRDLALPMPRQARGRVAYLHSYPTIRLSGILGIDTTKRISATYPALLFQQYPMDVLMEEDLTPETLAAYDAVVLPFADCVYEKTAPALRQYAAGGGTVLAIGGALSLTEYGEPLDASAVLGVDRRKRSEPQFVRTRLGAHGADISVTKTFDVTPRSARPIDDQGTLFVHEIGQGRVYWLAGETTAECMEAVVSLTLASVRKYGTVEAADDGAAPASVEFQIMDRGQRKLMLLVNWDDHGTRLLRLRLRLDSGGYLRDPLTGAEYLSPSGERLWARAALENGVLLRLPPQERLLVECSADPFTPGGTATTESAIRTEFERIRAAEAPVLAALDKQEQELLAGRRSARCFEAVDPSRCFFVDLAAHANMAFRDDVEGDKIGGWFDQGPNDFRNMPLGVVKLADVPFRILDPAANVGKAALVLYGPARPYFPKEIKDIPVGRQANHLYFLHTAGWGINDGELCHTYRILYDNGESIEIPVVYGADISGWWQPSTVAHAKIALESSNQMEGRIGLYALRWSNPRPKLTIRSMSIVASENNVVPAIVAITGETDP